MDIIVFLLTTAFLLSMALHFLVEAPASISITWLFLSITAITSLLNDWKRRSYIIALLMLRDWLIDGTLLRIFGVIVGLLLTLAGYDWGKDLFETHIALKFLLIPSSPWLTTAYIIATLGIATYYGFRLWLVGALANYNFYSWAYATIAFFIFIHDSEKVIKTTFSQLEIPYLSVFYAMGAFHILFIGAFLWKSLIDKYNEQKDALGFASQDSKSFDSFLVEDIALNPNSADILGFKDEVALWAPHILGINPERQAFILGLTAVWGAGKTSFIELLKNELLYGHFRKWEIEPSNNSLFKSLKEQPIVYSFNPWLSNSPAQFIADFFSSLEEKVGVYSTPLAKGLSAYADKLLKFIKENDKKVAALTDLLLQLDKTSLGEQKEALEEGMRRLNRKVIVFIDDLDRIDKKEIVEVLRVVRNVSSFPNMIFILAYDREYIEEAIKEINAHKYDTYLEKIIQLEIDVPKKKEYALTNWLVELIEKDEQLNALTNDSNAIEHLKNLLKTNPTHTGLDIENYLKTPRDVVRFYNLFKTRYLILKDVLAKRESSAHILADQYFIVQLLRFCYPDIWSMLRDGKEPILTQNGVNGKGMPVFALNVEKEHIIKNKLAEKLGLVAEFKEKTTTDKDLFNEF